MDNRIAPFWPIIEEQALSYALDPYLVGAIILRESGGDPNAFNKKSYATGLCQVIPREYIELAPKETWVLDRPTIAQLKDPKTNVEWGCKILDWFDNVSRGNMKNAVYKYSGGDKWEERYPGRGFQEYEAQYWNKVQAFKQQLEGTGDVALTDLLQKRLGAMYADYRAKFKAADPDDDYRPMDSRQARYLTVHHATGPRNASVEGIHAFHKNTRGWPGIGYHFVIRLGVLYYVGDVDTMRAHVANRNDEALGVCLTGDYSSTLPAEEDLGVLRVLVACLDAYYGHQKEVTDHGSMLPGYKCPGSALHDWLEQNDLRAPLVQDTFAIGAGVRAAMKERGDTPATNEDYYPFGSLTRGKRHLYLWLRDTGRVYVAEAA